MKLFHYVCVMTSILAASTQADFLLPIEDAFAISGRGVSVTGKVERGSVKMGDEVEIVGYRSFRSVCADVENFNKVQGQVTATAGDQVGVLLRGIKREDVERGQVMATPGSIKAYQSFEASVHLFDQEDGGATIVKNSSIRLQIRTASLSGRVQPTGDADKIKPGETTHAKIILVNPVALEEGQEVLVLNRNGKKIGTATVSMPLDS
ncbi:P-loop containing nucleoside triphosphate hydrolase protein [Penicillium pulvis]|uniref:P-loop containing nucleoside triphosphate hydrolase protein n=1 Tax=Penicillium pulvis TaxID=1562058 RepID=UPI00254938DC|nr:P-loop containing nucleoside triphosphate hydrolase protein [Penicillium pulvis]KAJ5792046.1 P-loop containing nucleoside triphosphate hydrolase protein [Penicillium pulvis]